MIAKLAVRVPHWRSYVLVYIAILLNSLCIWERSESQLATGFIVEAALSF